MVKTLKWIKLSNYITLTPGQKEPASNGKKGIFHTPQGFRIHFSALNSIYCLTQDTNLAKKSYVRRNQYILRPTNQSSRYSKLNGTSVCIYRPRQAGYDTMSFFMRRSELRVFFTVEQFSNQD